METVAVLAFLMSTTGAFSGARSPDATDQIILQEREWSAAFLRHDVAVLERIIANDFVGTDGRGVMSTKADEIAEAHVPQPGAPVAPAAIVNEVLSDFHVRRYGELAVLTSRNDETVRAGDREMVFTYRRTTVWVKRQGRWQCVSFHASRVQSPC